MNVICCQTGAEEGQGHLRDWLAETLSVSFLFPTLLWWCISCLLCGQESSGTRQKCQGSARATPEPKWETSSHNTCVPPERSLIEPSPSILWARQWYERLSVLIRTCLVMRCSLGRVGDGGQKMIEFRLQTLRYFFLKIDHPICQLAFRTPSSGVCKLLLSLSFKNNHFLRANHSV